MRETPDTDSAASAAVARAVFGPVETPRASDVFAGKVRDWILAGDRPDGTPLPTERQLMEQTGLGRSTIREALRILQSEGLVTSKVGPKGGYSVRRPDLQTVIDSVSVFLRGQRFRLVSLIEARMAIEPACAALAAQRATTADLDALEEAERRLEEESSLGVEALSEANYAWHLRLAQASHNELLIALVTALSSVMREASERVIETLPDSVMDALPEIRLAHGRVLEALRARDADAAERRVRRHVDGYAKLVERLTAEEAAARR